MNIILLEKIKKLGDIGDEVKVKSGYARNFLVPNKKALYATSENRKYFEEKKTEIKLISGTETARGSGRSQTCANPIVWQKT